MREFKGNVLDLFSGIGGFSLGLERAGMKTVAFCEIEDFPRKVLAKHWPGVPIYEDVRNVTKRRLDADGIRPDVVCGGFPCQDISVAGNQKGITGERSGLWGELCRIISEVRPKYAIVENVTALISGDSGRWFGRVLGDLAEIGYDCEWHCISASELDAHHHRDRVWVICYPKHIGWNAAEIREGNQAGDGSDTEGEKSAGESSRPSNAENMAHANSQRQEQAEKTHDNGINEQKPDDKLTRRLRELLRESKTDKTRFTPFGLLDSIKPTIRRDSDGLSYRVDRIKGLGNAVVPQIPELIGRAIMEVESTQPFVQTCEELPSR